MASRCASAGLMPRALAAWLAAFWMFAWVPTCSCSCASDGPMPAAWSENCLASALCCMLVPCPCKAANCPCPSAACPCPSAACMAGFQFCFSMSGDTEAWNVFWGDFIASPRGSSKESRRLLVDGSSKPMLLATAPKPSLSDVPPDASRLAPPRPAKMVSSNALSAS